MIFVDEMKNLKIYKRQFFLPYNDKDKKHGSLIYLLTPNYLSSKRLMNSPLVINRKYFESYYMERNVTYYINSSASKKALEEYANTILDLRTPVDKTEQVERFTEYYVSSVGEDEFWTDKYYGSINEALKADRIGSGEYNVYTRELCSDSPSYIGKIEVSLIEFTDYDASYKWIDKPVIIDEGVFKSEKDIYYNKDKFDSGEINLCFITGHSGSGKTTMANGIKAESFELDDLQWSWKFSDENLKEYGDLPYSFFKGQGKKYRIPYRIEKNGKMVGLNYDDVEKWFEDNGFGSGSNTSFYKDATEDFVKYAIQYAKAHKNKKFVINGIQLFLFINPNELEDCAVYIKGTSAVKSTLRSVKRDSIGNKPSDIIDNIDTFYRRIKDTIGIDGFEAKLNLYRKFFEAKSIISEYTISKKEIKDIIAIKKSLSNEDKTNEFDYTSDDILNPIYSFNKKLNSYDYGILKNGKIAEVDGEDFYRNYKLESIQEFERNKGGVCWDFVYYEDYYFKRNFKNIRTKLFYIIIDDNKNCPCHTFLTFKYNNNYYWFESSWGKYQGVHKFNSENELVDYVVAMHNNNYNKNNYPVYIRSFSTSEIRPGMNTEQFMSVMDKGLKKITPKHISEAAATITFGDDITAKDVKWMHIDNQVIQTYKKDIKGLSHVRTSPNDTGYLFIDNKTGKPIGYVSVEDKDGDKWIQALEVLPDFRRCGYGTDLLKFAQNQGAKFLSVNKNNDAALDMYQKNNWKINGGTDNMHFMIHEETEVITDVPEITKRWGIISDNGAYNACCQVKGYSKPMRERASMIVFNSQGQIYGIMDDEGNHISLPGGGLNEGEDPKAAAIRETEEEARIRTTNVFFAGKMIEYDEECQQWVKDHVKNPNDWWYGYYSYIYIGKQVGSYNGHIDDVDKDDMLKKGQWFDLKDAWPYIDQGYKDAIVKHIGSPISLSEDGPTIPEITVPEVPDPGKDLKNYIRTLKMRGKKGAYQLADTQREFMRNLPTPDSIGSAPSPSSSDNENGDEEKNTSEAMMALFAPESDNHFIMNEAVIMFQEDTNADTKLRKALYNERMRTTKDQVLLLKKVKEENPFIKYAFPDKFDRYQNRNVFYDMSYYIEVYFRNAQMYKLTKGVDLLITFMERLFDQKRIPASYTKKTVFIPIFDWSAPNTRSWLFRESINPISAIFYLINNGNIDRLKKMFGKMDIIFFGNTNYFKINFSELNPTELKQLKVRFKTFVSKIISNLPFDPEEEDETPDVESTKVIVTNITDKIEQNRGVKMSTQSELIGKSGNKDIKAFAATGVPVKANNKGAYSVKASNEDPKIANTGTVKKAAEKKVEETTPKSTSKSAKEQKLKDAESVEKKKVEVINTVRDVAAASKNTDDALAALDDQDDEDFKKMLMDLEAEDGDAPKMSKSREARMMDLNKKFMDKEVKGKKVSELISEDYSNPPLPATTIEVDSPFQDQWSNMRFINFDSTYDINRDIMKMLAALETKRYPLAVRDLDIKDASTTEDYIDTYTIQFEDTNGKRFTIKLDIPKFKDDKYLILRGNKKTIQNQYFNMPILKTEPDTVQIISNYNKIFIRRFGNTTGKTISYCDRLIKALKKYNGNKIKLTYGDNSKLSDSFEAPIDYIDIGSVYSKIECEDVTFYFNQDEFKSLYKDKMIDPDAFYYGVRNGKLIDFKTYDGESVLSNLIAATLCTMDSDFEELWANVSVAKKHVYSKASIMSSEIPLVIVAAMAEGLTSVLQKARINYDKLEKLTPDIRRDPGMDWIKFSDGFLVYRDTYSSSLLLNGLKDINPEEYSIDDIDSRKMWVETLDGYGGRVKADGLDNFYECMVDPITLEVLQYYKLPQDYVSMLIYGNNLLADNKYISHGDSSSRRVRKKEVIAVKVYKALFNDAYGKYANQMRKGGNSATFSVKQSAVIDLFMTDPTSSDLSVINCLNDVESLNAVSAKGESGMNSERAYTLDKRTYDTSMLNILGLSTGFANNVGVTRQATLNANINTERGYVSSIDGDTSKLSAADTLTATEALNPMGSTRDDPLRTGMTFIQTSKHQVRTAKSDPLLVTNGSDEVIPYITTDIFCKKSKMDGKVIEKTDTYMIVEYKDKSHDYVDLSEKIEKNSDGGFYVNTQLVTDLKEGSHFKSGQILAYEKQSFSKGKLGESDKLAYNVGKLIKIAVVNSDDNFEDSALVTTKLAEDLATDIIMKEQRILSKDTNIYNFIKVGTQVNQEDVLFETQTAYDDEDINVLLKNLAGDEEQISKLGRRPVKSPTAGVVAGIMLYRTCEIEEMSESLQKIFKEYERDAKKQAAHLKQYGIDDPTLLPSIGKLPPTGKMKNAPNSVLIEVYIKYHDIVSVGDKIVYWSANKGVVHDIIESKDAPYTDYRPDEEISAFTGISSINKRQIASNVIIGSLNKMCVELGRQVRDILGLPYYENEIDI